MEQILEKLFESIPKVKVLRVFMQNPEGQFTFPELLRITQLRSRIAQRELKKMLKIGLLKQKIATLREEIRPKISFSEKSPKIVLKTRRVRVYLVNPDSKILPELKDLVVKASVASPKKLLDKIQRLGKVKLVVLSGVFLRNDNSRTDILIVGDNIKQNKFGKFISSVESDLGKSIRYTLLDTDEFKYRLDMYDRFLRDLLEYPHEKLINKLRV